MFFSEMAESADSTAAAAAPLPSSSAEISAEISRDRKTPDAMPDISAREGTIVKFKDSDGNWQTGVVVADKARYDLFHAWKSGREAVPHMTPFVNLTTRYILADGPDGPDLVRVDENLRVVGWSPWWAASSAEDERYIFPSLAVCSCGVQGSNCLTKRAYTCKRCGIQRQRTTNRWFIPTPSLFPRNRAPKDENEKLLLAALNLSGPCWKPQHKLLAKRYADGAHAVRAMGKAMAKRTKAAGRLHKRALRRMEGEYKKVVAQAKRRTLADKAGGGGK